MDHQARYSSYHKSIILTMTLFFIFPPLLFNTTYFIHVVTRTLRLWIDDPCMNGTMTPLDPGPRFATVNSGRGTRQCPQIMWLWLCVAGCWRCVGRRGAAISSTNRGYGGSLGCPTRDGAAGGRVDRHVLMRYGFSVGAWLLLILFGSCF
jgi:hypothetical protein